MPTSTVWDHIEAIAARRYAELNAPAAVAVRAISDLRVALEDLTGTGRADVLALLRDEIPAAAVCAFDAF